MAKAPEVVAADYGVPHTKYQQTDDGFTVTYKRTSLLPIIIIVCFTGISMTITLIGLIVLFLAGVSFWAMVATLNPILLYFLVRKLSRYTKITVDPEFVTIDEKKMDRDDFGNFTVYSSQDLQIGRGSASLCQLGYQFGNRSFPIRGFWGQREAQEVASALNRKLQNSPRAAHDVRTSPEMLRAARPTDF